MELALIIGLVFVLYIRTLGYNYVIDDNVPRGGYLYDVPMVPPSYEFYCTKPKKIYRLFMILMHCVNVWIIYMLWGFGPAIIFAVHPMAAWGVCWVTGNYYATAAYFTLIAYFILHQFPNIWGALVALPIFTAALNSTVCPINFPFFAAITMFPWGCAFLVPLAGFLFGKKFQTGIKIRLEIAKNPRADQTPTLKRLYLMTVVVGRYTYDVLFPGRCGFFGPLGQGCRDKPEVLDYMQSPSKEFWTGLALILSVLTLGLIVQPVGVLWFFIIIALHSQWNLTGQFYAQRYLYLPMIGLCVVAGTLLQPYPILLTVAVTFLAIRTLLFIPAWKNQGTVLKNDIENYPENAQTYNSYAQWVMSSGKPLGNIQMNELAMNLFRSEEMDKGAWETQMNLAAFFSMLNQWQEAYRRTLVAIDLLKPLGGMSNPMDALLIQKKNLEMVLEKISASQAAGAQVVSDGGLLGSSLSRPTDEIAASPRKEETNG
jgi:hypothetical protein